METKGDLRECYACFHTLDNPRRDWKRAVFTVVSRSDNNDVAKKLDASRMGRTVFDGRWRYTKWPDDTAELYDHDNDPFEYANLIKDGKQHSRLVVMKKMLAEGWQAALPGK